MTRLSKKDQRLIVLTFRNSVGQDSGSSRHIGEIVKLEWRQYSQETKDDLTERMNEKIQGKTSFGGSEFNDEYWFGVKYFMDMDGGVR